MKKLLLLSTISKIILKVEVEEWYKINLCKDDWRKFDNSDTSNMFSSISIECRVRFNDTYSVQLASYWKNGNIAVVPVLENEKHYLYFVVKH